MHQPLRSGRVAEKKRIVGGVGVIAVIAVILSLSH
jgi:hypothetical protein